MVTTIGRVPVIALFVEVATLAAAAMMVGAETARIEWTLSAVPGASGATATTAHRSRAPEIS
ncbi:hypothetical protein, partial [Streptomyces sp. NPDC055506]